MHKFEFKKYKPALSKEDASFKKTLLRHKAFRIVLGALFGALAGLLYWEFIGCSGGSCPLTSNPYKTVALFAFVGAMMNRKKEGIGCC